MADDLFINNKISLPATELKFTATRSSGPGGQHVNTTDTRIQVRWNLEASTVLTRAQKERVRGVLQARLTCAGDLILASDGHRSQRRNREDVCQRLAALLRGALVPPKPRRATRPTKASRQRRLDDKKRRAARKKDRRDDGGDY